MDFKESDFEGLYYQGEFDKLNNQIESCFLKEPGPGVTPEQRNNNEEIIGIIAPCDDYNLSGYCAAWAYKRIAETKFKDLYIIIGHSENGKSGILLHNVKTPLGIVKTDMDFGNEFHKLTNISPDTSLFEKNYSIELQLPFIQFSSRDKLNLLKVACVSIGNDIDYDQIRFLAESIKRILKESNKNATYICSSNLVHFGREFNYTPFAYNIKESVEDIDYHSIELISSKKPKELIDFIKKEETTIYGYNAIALFLELAKNSEENKMLEYYQSDIFRNREKVKEELREDENFSFTSYASFEFR